MTRKLKNIHHTLTITCDDESAEFFDDVIDRGPETDDDVILPPVWVDLEANTFTWVNPTLEQARELVEWALDTVTISHEYGDSAAHVEVRYDHVDAPTNCDCTACREGYLDNSYFTA